MGESGQFIFQILHIFRFSSRHPNLPLHLPVLSIVPFKLPRKLHYLSVHRLSADMAKSGCQKQKEKRVRGEREGETVGCPISFKERYFTQSVINTLTL